jgi:hypothetical protein
VLPSWPLVFDPQHRTVRSDSTAHVCDAPTLTEVAVEMPVTLTGVVRVEVEPSPSWPLAFAPQHSRVPSARFAQPWVETSTPTTPGFSPSDFYNGAFIFTQWTSQIDLGRELDVGFAEPLNLAIGAEYRRESYEIKAGDPGSYYKEGVQAYPGFEPTDAGKNQHG